MQLELIANLIEAMDFRTFREFVREVLSQRGYQAVISDGWSDGGRDIRVYELSGRVAKRLAFQTSVEWQWSGKLWEDLVKAKNKLGCDDFVYITNRRIGDAVFHPLVQSALTDEQVHLSKFDKQDLAAHIIDTGREEWFADLLKLPLGGQVPKEVSLQTEVADSFILFSDDADDFRDRITEHAIKVALLRDGSMNRADLAEVAVKVIDFNDSNRIQAAIDRLQQIGDIIFEHNKFTLSDSQRKRYTASKKLLAGDRMACRDAIGGILRRYLPGCSAEEVEHALSEVEKLLGTLVRRYTDYQVELLKDSDGVNDIRQQYIQETTRIESAVNACGVPLAQVKQCIGEINDVAKEHPVVTRLAAGDVFRRLVPCNKSSLLNALGQVNGIHLYLEPTVAIPLLCSKLYQTADGNRDIRAAQWLFERASPLQVKFCLPDVYLEECAVHLVVAGRYVNVFARNKAEELLYSENAFVAYYAALSDRGKINVAFREFLQLFGFVATGEFHARKQQVQARLRSLFNRYRIETVPVSRTKQPNAVRVVAEQDLDHVWKQNHIDKAPVLTRHDVKMLAYARSRSTEEKSAIMLATWDRSLQTACRLDDYEWWCLDPIHAGDIMALVQPGHFGAMGLDVAMLLDDVHLKQAAKVWDAIVRIEQDNMFDAERIGAATRFKKQFLSRQSGEDLRFTQIKESWAAALEEEAVANSTEPNSTK